MYIIWCNKTDEGLAEWHWECHGLEVLVVTEAHVDKMKTPGMYCGFLHIIFQCLYLLVAPIV